MTVKRCINFHFYPSHKHVRYDEVSGLAEPFLTEPFKPLLREQTSFFVENKTEEILGTFKQILPPLPSPLDFDFVWAVNHKTLTLHFLLKNLPQTQLAGPETA